MFHVESVDKLDVKNQQNIELALQKAEPQKIRCNNWAKEYPYAPQVEFRMVHDGGHLVVRFDVKENYTMAKVDKDNGEVWTDSCVEFFISLDGNGYYNFETTPIGKMLMAFRKERPNPEYASKEIMSSITRLGTMGTKPFDEIQGHNHWSMTLIIPAEAMFKHKLKSWSGVEATMNLFKCGDNLSHPHFLSWKPIRTPQPDFHRPEFFGDVKFK